MTPDLNTVCLSATLVKIDEALDKARLDVVQRIACKHLLAERGCLRLRR